MQRPDLRRGRLLSPKEAREQKAAALESLREAAKDHAKISRRSFAIGLDAGDIGLMFGAIKGMLGGIFWNEWLQGFWTAITFSIIIFVTLSLIIL